MATLVGNLIKTYRKQKKISLKDLSYGVCTISTLSRIEQGIYMPNFMQIRVFFTRLGKNEPKDIIPITKKESELYDLETKLLKLSDSRDKNRLILLEKYEKCLGKRDFLGKQIYLLEKAIYLSQFDDCLEESRKMCIKALQITRPNFPDDAQIIPSGFYSYVELILINNIAHSEYYIFDIFKTNVEYRTNAINKMKFLKSYYENNIEDYENNNMYTVILFNLTNWIGLSGDFSQALELSKKGILVSKNNPYYLFRHIFNKGYNLAELGDLKNAEIEIKRALRLIRITKDFGDADYLSKVVREKFKLNV